MSGPRVFISYSHQDEAWKNRLVRQLRVLELEGDLEVWDDQVVGGSPHPLAPPPVSLPSPAGRGGQGVGFCGCYDSCLSYSACVPIQNQTMPSGFSLPSARLCAPTRTDHSFFVLLTCLRCSDGW